MLPQDEKYGGWAASGEIDILEAKGQEPTKVLGTLHFGSRWPANTEASKTLRLAREAAPSPTSTSTRWNGSRAKSAGPSMASSIRPNRSGGAAARPDGGKGAKPASEADLNPWPAPFDQPFYLVMNLAVGGHFPGNPDKTTVFPAEMLVDYVRVYDKVGGYGKTKPRGKGKLPFSK